MFKSSITATPFTTDAANGFFHDTIHGQSFGGDCSFLATLRALLAPRLPSGDTIHLMFGSSRYSASDLKNVSVESAIRAILRNVDLDEHNFIYIHSFSNSSENNMANMSCLEKKLTSLYPQFSRLDAITAFFRKTFNVDCFINAEQKTVLVFVDGLDNRKLHYLQCSILAMLPWYFDKEAGVTAKEMELIKSLRETSSEKYLALLSEMASQYDFKSARVRQMLVGFETRYERLELQNVRNTIESIDVYLDNLNDQIGQKLRQRNEQCIKLAGLERRINEGHSGDSEIMEYFLCNNRLYLESVTDTDMYFSVKDYVSYFDKDIAESMIQNRRSAAYRFCGSRYDLDKVEKLLRELFLSDAPKLRIRTCAAYRFNLNGNVSGQAGHMFDADFNDAIPNMHIQRHSCLGNYSSTLNRLLRDRNYIGALEQCVASCKSLNFGDGIVIEEFFKEFYSGSDFNNRCVELPDGSVVKPFEAIHWLEEQEAQQEAQAHGQEEQSQGQQEERTEAAGTDE